METKHDLVLDVVALGYDTSYCIQGYARFQGRVFAPLDRMHPDEGRALIFGDQEKGDVARRVVGTYLAFQLFKQPGHHRSEKGWRLEDEASRLWIGWDDSYRLTELRNVGILPYNGGFRWPPLPRTKRPVLAGVGKGIFNYLVNGIEGLAEADIEGFESNIVEVVTNLQQARKNDPHAKNKVNICHAKFVVELPFNRTRYVKEAVVSRLQQVLI